MWGIFFTLLLGLISTVLGAAAGVAGVRRLGRRRVPPTTTTTGPIVTDRTRAADIR